jgi:hypothetical protein
MPVSENNQQRSEESLRHEYSEAVQNIRHYGNIRFAIFTIFFAVIGGIGYVAFGKGQFDTHAALVARIAAVPVIALFWMYEERTGLRFEHSHRIAVSLEQALNYTHYTSWPASTQFPPAPSLINRLLFALLTVAWVYACITVGLDC